MTSPASPTSCPQCSQPVLADAVFCHNCGRQLRVAASGAALEAPGATAVAKLTCPRCSASNDAGSRFCYACGLPFEGDGAGGAIMSPGGAAVGAPAGFWVRFAAQLIDGVLFWVLYLIISSAIGMPEAVTPDPTATPEQVMADFFEQVLPSFFLISGIMQALSVAYNVIGWSAFGTTLGKRALSLYVVRPQGERPSFWRALWRYAAIQLTGWLIIGYLMIAFRGDKRGLHDLLADTYVVRR